MDIFRRLMAGLGSRPVVLMHYVIYFSQQISEVDIILILIQQMRH